jgi:Domain of unknown function (DUF4136)
MFRTRTPRTGSRLARTCGSSLAFALLLAACAGPPRIDTETAPSADFSRRQTFAWQESQASYDPQPGAAHDAEKVKAAIHEAVVSQLAQKGYSPANGHQPDFLVSFHLVLTESQAPDLCVRRHAIFELGVIADSVETYEICREEPIMKRRTVRKGTLVVFVVDARSRTLLWQGVADEGSVSRTNQIEKLRSAVQQMFATFPEVSA